MLLNSAVVAHPLYCVLCEPGTSRRGLWYSHHSKHTYDHTYGHTPPISESHTSAVTSQSAVTPPPPPSLLYSDSALESPQC